MSKKKNNSGIVYSTDPDFSSGEQSREEATVLPAEQKLRVLLETKHRAGKMMTVVTGFVGTDPDLQELGKKLKVACGTGGSVKDGEILIQGDHRARIAEWLLKNGYSSVKKM